MALGGGTWIAQNKKLPGAYINFVSANRATSLLSERGIAAMPLILNWGIEGEVFKVTNEDFEENALKIFGYDYANENLANIRDLFLNAKTLYAYRLGTGTKATCKYCTAKYSGTRGNDLKIVVTTNEIGGFNIKTMLDNSIVDSQDIATENSDDEIPAVIAKINSLKDNDFVSWTNDISIEAGTISLSGGTNSMPTTENYSEFLKKLSRMHLIRLAALTQPKQLKNFLSHSLNVCVMNAGSKFNVYYTNMKLLTTRVLFQLQITLMQIWFIGQLAQVRVVKLINPTQIKFIMANLQLIPISRKQNWKMH